MSKDITLSVDYHDRACVVRWFKRGQPATHFSQEVYAI
jgi:hypothetical protein